MLHSCLLGTFGQRCDLASMYLLIFCLSKYLSVGHISPQNNEKSHFTISELVGVSSEKSSKVIFLCWMYSYTGIYSSVLPTSVGHACVYVICSSFQLVWVVPVPVLPTGMVCTCAYIVCWGCKEGLAMEKMFRSVGSGSWVGLAGTESRRWQGWWCNLEAGLSPGGDCTRAVEFHQSWGQGWATLLIKEWEREGHRMCPGV